MKNLFFALIVMLLSACAVQAPLSESTRTKPSSSGEDVVNEDLVRVAIVGLNDFHGNLFPKENKAHDGSLVKSGGASVFAAQLEILKREMHGNMMIVNAGDEWQGTIDSNHSKGAHVVNFFNRIGVKVAAVGNHEFDFSLPVLHKRLREARYPYVASNIFVKETGNRVQWPNVYPSRIFEVGGIKFGVIGVSTIHTPFTTSYDVVKPFEFREALGPVQEQEAVLRTLGAQAVLVTAHAGTACAGDLKKWNIYRSPSDPGARESECDLRDEIGRLATEVKPGQLDGIVAGHTHQVIHHFLRGIPVVQGEAYNQYFNIIYYSFSKKTGKIIPDLTAIEGPIPICAQYFEGTKHCDVRMLPALASTKMIAADFHGEVVKPDVSIEAWLKPIWKATEKLKNRVVGKTLLPLEHPRDRESPLANLAANMMRDRAKTDFAFQNSGGVRAPISAGDITYNLIFQSFPFDNALRRVQVSGEELMLIVRIASSGTHGFPDFAGGRLTVHRDLKNAELEDDLNQDGKKEAWEYRRLISFEQQLPDGSYVAIVPKGQYTIAMSDYHTNGGDHLVNVMSKLKPPQITVVEHTPARESYVRYLMKHSPVNTVNKPLVDPKNPRLVVVD